MTKLIIEGDPKKLNVIQSRFRTFGVTFSSEEEPKKEEPKKVEKQAQKAKK